MKRLFLILALMASPAHAQISESDEARARDIGHQLRCVVCQNQSIEESEAELALDMKKIVRDRIVAGESDTQIMAYMQSRYGDYVLLKPPVQSNTYVLWFLPAGLVLLGLGWFALRSNRAGRVAVDADMSEEDRALLDQLMADDQ